MKGKIQLANMKDLSSLDKAKRVFYLIYGREPAKGEELTLADSLVFASASQQLSDWAIASGFAKKAL